MDMITLAAAKSYTKKTLDGIGSLQGKDGKSAYQIWLDNGNKGTEQDFLNSLKGAKGDKGDKGDQGIQGLKGDKGDKGEKGETGANGSNGKDGSDGTDGVGIKSVVQTTTSSADGGSNIITVTKTDNTTSTFTVKNGSKGSKGDKGDTGATGPKGEAGEVNISGAIVPTEIADKVETTDSGEINANIFYDFGLVTELSLTFVEGDPDKVNEYMFSFTSGETATVLTLPSSIQWVNELTVEPNKRYEVSIVDNIGLWCAVDLVVVAE